MAIIMVAGLVVAFACTNRHAPGYAPMRALHHSIGVLTLALLVLRAAIQFRVRSIRRDAMDWADWLDWVAQGVHAVLYTLMFMIPMLGWALVNARGHEVIAFGLTLPNITAGRNPDLEDTLVALHVSAAWIFIGMATLHVAGIVWRHLVWRDKVLVSMLPQGILCASKADRDPDHATTGK